MKAMIMAAGRGERIRPLSDETPKPLLEVRGKPLIVHHLEALAQAGIKQVVINLSWLGEQIRQRLGSGESFGLDIAYSEETEPLEVAGGIVQALDLLGEQFILVNGDVFTDYDFSALTGVEQDAHLVLVDNPAHHPDGDFACRDGLVVNNAEPRFTYSGIACFRRNFFAGLSAGKRSLAPLLMQAADEGRVSAELYTGLWQDVGTVERLQALD